MKEPNAFYTISKKTIYKVVIAHILFLIIFSISFKSHKKPSKNLIVKNITVKTTPKPAPLKKTIANRAIKKPIQKKKAVNKTLKRSPTPKKTAKKIVSNTLLSQLENSLKNLEKIESKPPSKKLLIPKKIDTLNIEKSSSLSQKSKNTKYKQLLVKELQDNLKFPEYGEVKVSFIIDKGGNLSNVQILDFQSEKNKNYLKNTLPEIRFIWFDEIFNEKQNFTVTFKNE